MTFGGTIPIRIIEPKTSSRFLTFRQLRLVSFLTNCNNRFPPSRKVESKFADETGGGKENAGGRREVKTNKYLCKSRLNFRWRSD